MRPFLKAVVVGGDEQEYAEVVDRLTIDFSNPVFVVAAAAHLIDNNWDTASERPVVLTCWLPKTTSLKKTMASFEAVVPVAL